jgi:hypothetical protein
VGAVVAAAVLAAVELAEGVAAAAAATAPGDSPISTSNASEATNHIAPITTANPPSFGTAGQAMRRDRDKVFPAL